MGSSTPLFSAPIAAPAESLPQALPALLEEVWRRIASGLNGRWPPWGLPMLATVSPPEPRARVLALRSVDPAQRLFVFHTDARSRAENGWSCIGGLLGSWRCDRGTFYRNGERPLSRPGRARGVATGFAASSYRQRDRKRIWLGALRAVAL